jgi:hypothetical protein
MRKLIGLLFLVFIGLFVYFTFVKKEDITPERVKDEAVKAAEKIKDLASRKDELLKAAEEEMKNAERQMSEIKVRIKNAKSNRRK